MSVRIRLTGGDALTARANMDEAEGALAQALREGTLLRVIDDRGRRLAVNPRLVLYLEDCADWTVRLAEDGGDADPLARLAADVEAGAIAV
jgi:hypothetical protein